MKLPGSHIELTGPCRKHKYSEAGAIKSLNLCSLKRTKGNKRRKERGYYWCIKCSYYHLTSKFVKNPKYDL